MRSVPYSLRCVIVNGAYQIEARDQAGRLIHHSETWIDGHTCAGFAGLAALVKRFGEKR